MYLAATVAKLGALTICTEISVKIFSGKFSQGTVSLGFSPELRVFHTNGKRSRFFRSATQVKLCWAGLGTGWVTHRE